MRNSKEKKIETIILRISCLAGALFILILMTVLSTSCSSRKADPVSEAIGRQVRHDTRIPIHVERAVAVDSTTYTTEFDRRRGIYELRIRQNALREENFLKDRKKKNAKIMHDAIIKDHLIIAGLDSLRQVMGSRVDDIAYYDYAFQYCQKDDRGRKTVPKTAWASVTPDNKVLSWAPEKRLLHKTTGLVIPGYRKMLDSLKEKEEN